MNLAVQLAVSEDRGKDLKYIFENFLFYHRVGSIVQELNITEIASLKELSEKELEALLKADTQ